MSRYGDVYENRVTGERAVVLRGDEDGGAEPALVHLTVKPGGAVVGEHVHPRVQERFRVIAGTLGTKVDGVERTLEAGADVTVPAGTRHDWWNAGDRDADVLIELSPPEEGPRFEAMIATLFGLANAGRTNGGSRPTVARTYPEAASAGVSAARQASKSSRGGPGGDGVASAPRIVSIR